ncbi:MAG: hypothetical protein ACFFA4_10980 [Promethearchaeota archaeon]
MKKLDYSKNTLTISLVFLFILSALITSFSVFCLGNSLRKINFVNEIENFQMPKISATQINITTPNNITYTAPVNGYYPSTYGFENEYDGTNGTSIWFVDTKDASCTVNVLSELDQHQKVLNYSTPLSDRWVRNRFDSSKTSGTVEFWVRLGEIDIRHTIYLADDSGGSISLNWWEDGYVKYDDSGTPTTIEAYSALQWYHVRIEFDLTTDWHLWINGVSKDGGAGYGYDAGNPTSFEEFVFGGQANSNFWLDAVSYSWDQDYSIGNNFYEGLFLSFDLGFTPDWLGYSIDGLANKTIIGNTTICFPINDGLHKIQIFGNDSISTIYQSDKRFFSTQLINIVTPRSQFYSEPMSKYYPATYGFESENVGTSGTNIRFVDLKDTDCSVNIISELDQHKKVLHYNTPLSDRWVRNRFDSSKTSGTVEFWIRLEGINYRYVIYLADDSGGSISLSWWEDGYVKYDDSGTPTTIEAYSALQWYHVRIEFDLTTDWHLWINGVSKDGGAGYGYDAGNPTSFEEFVFGGQANSDFWLDAVSYSWDQDYSVGDNYNEGLLLSFDLGFTPDWLGYSQDGLNNKTIVGNKTIPFPLSEGLHSIQVFGNNSVDTMFHSEVKYFSIDTSAPVSLISFTPHSTPNIVLESTLFSIISDDGLGSGVSLIRYKINDSSWFVYTGPFNLMGHPYDTYEISYHAIDNVVNVENENSIIVVLVPEPVEPGIPGFNIVIMIGVLSIASIILLKRKLKK